MAPEGQINLKQLTFPVMVLIRQIPDLLCVVHMNNQFSYTGDSPVRSLILSETKNANSNA